MHNLEELHYPIKKFELFQRPNVKILTPNDLLFFLHCFSLIIIEFIKWPVSGIYYVCCWKEREVEKF